MSSKENFLEKTNEALTSIKSIDVKEEIKYITIKKDAISFLNVLKNNIDSSDGYFLTNNTNNHRIYNVITQEVDNIINLAENFNNSNDNNVLNNIPSYIDNIIGNFSNIVMPSFNYDINCIENNKNLESSYKELEEVLSNHKNKADEIDTQFNNINNNVDNLIKNTETRFDDAYKSQTEFINKKNEEFDYEYESQKEFIAKTQEEYIKKIKGYDSDIKKLHSDIEMVSGEVTGDLNGQVSNKNADQERIRAKNWSRGTVIAISASIIMFLGIYIKFLSFDNEISLISILHKYTINLPLLILALYLIIYCAKRSNHHLEKEAYYRDFAVKVHSIDPYIRSLSKDKQEDLKYEVARKLFMSSSDKVKQDKQNQKSTNDNNPPNEQQEKIGVIKIQPNN
ncbi:MAG: hypothetical protein P8N25_02790 [Alphaproteobacteria bacterium]|nr:hypothetical protein [Alphaproteobacteria bacterium]